MAKSKFETAFAAARKAGKKTFSFGGKSYNTKVKDGPSGKKAPTPRPRSERPVEKKAPTPRPRSERPRALVSTVKKYDGKKFVEERKIIGKVPGKKK